MKTIKLVSYLFLIINIFLSFSFINEFYNLRIQLFDLSFVLNISNLWTLISVSIVNFILCALFCLITLIFLRSNIGKKDFLKLILFLNFLISFLLFAVSTLIVNHAGDVKMFKDIL